MIRILPLAVLALVVLLVPAAASAQDGTAHSDNMSFVKNIPYEARNGADGRGANYGTDLEFARLRGRDVAVAGSYENGMHLIDVTRPEQAAVLGVYDCDILQGDVQVFTQEQEGGRTFATYTADAFGNAESACYREAAARGFEVVDARGRGKQGTFIVDITDPAAPETVSFVDVPQGSHNQSVHPSGDFLYNSNSDLITSLAPAIEIFDISDVDSPRKVGELAFPPHPGLGTESHDITFSDDGSRAYSAALSEGLILDTTDPAAPAILSRFVDQTINVWHQSDPFTITADDGTRRDFLLVEDEFAGAAGGPVCPSGGFHIYDITGEKERAPEKVGYWNIDDVRPTSSVTGTCTAHVFDIHEEAELMTVAFYNGGVRVVDLSGLATGGPSVSLGDTPVAGEGLREVGFFRFEDGAAGGSSDTWAVKTPRIDPRTGDFHLYGNDIGRGFDVYRFDGEGERSRNPGRWMRPAEAESYLLGRRAELPAVGTETSFFCLLPR